MLARGPQREFRDSELYIIRYQQCLTRSMTLVKMHFVTQVRALSLDVSKRMGDRVRPPSLPQSSPLFSSDQYRLRTSPKRLSKLCSTPRPPPSPSRCALSFASSSTAPRPRPPRPRARPRAIHQQTISARSWLSVTLRGLPCDRPSSGRSSRPRSPGLTRRDPISSISFVLPILPPL